MAMGNNPVINVDPDGEFFGTVLTGTLHFLKTAFLDGGLDPTSSGARQEAWRNYDPTRQGTPTNNAWRIDMGLFQTDPNLNFGQRVWQLFSRFTWEQPLTTIGNLYAHSVNWTGDVERVDYFAGSTVLWNANKVNSGTTIGSYINISSWRTDRNGVRFARRPGFLGQYDRDDLFIHEFGHYVQARQVSGPLTLLGGINSMISTAIEDWFGPPNFHDNSWWEMDASQRGLQYFIKTGRLDPSNPVTNNFIQNVYLVNNPSQYGKWWEHLTLPFAFLWRF
jgi:hypothetical protein